MTALVTSTATPLAALRAVEVSVVRYVMADQRRGLPLAR